MVRVEKFLYIVLLMRSKVNFKRLCLNFGFARSYGILKICEPKPNFRYFFTFFVIFA